ncbi:MAG: OmpW/AlkL family protein [Methylocella sp.]
MTGSIRIWAAVFIAALGVSQGRAADVAATLNPLPPAPPSFYVHAGAVGAFFDTNAQPTGGGLFPTANIAIRPVYTLGLEAGYFVTPNIATALYFGVPPIVHLKATGLPTAATFGSNLLGSTRAGPAILLLQYHFTQFGPLQPYAGIGVGYVFDFGNISDGILTNFSIDQNFAFVLQAGADLMLTPNWGVFVDAKKLFFSTDAQGFAVPGVVPVRSHIKVDPWLATAGIAFRY